MCLNVALYGLSRRWCMTERRRTALQQSATELQIGPSKLAWQDGTLEITINERTMPGARHVRGVVRLQSSFRTGRVFGLDDGGHHQWSPIAPGARVAVELDQPALRWSGPAYLDCNWGARSLEADFSHWDWCRAPTADGAAILYNATRREGGEQCLALRVQRDGAITAFPPPPPASLPPTLWRIARPTRAEAPPKLVRTLEDAPFYARSVVQTRLCGEDATAIHESLVMDRFTNPLVQAMLPFKIARRFW